MSQVLHTETAVIDC